MWCYSMTNNNNYISFSGNEILITNPYNILLKEDADQILIYLGLNPIREKHDNAYYEILNTTENRTKAENVEVVIKKILKMQYKIAEEFVNSFIDDKDIK